MGHAAAALARRHGGVGEEVPIERGGALVDQVAEDEEQRQHCGRAQQGDETGHHAARDASSHRAGAHNTLLPTAAPRATRHTRSRAAAFTAMVMTNNSSPTSMRAERYRLVVASVNSLASAAAIVEPGCSRERLMSCRLPMS